MTLCRTGTELQESDFNQALMEKFIPTVDVGISLTASGIDNIKCAMPRLHTIPFFVCHHPHYRSILGSYPFNESVRESFGVKSSQKCLCIVGTLRPNKHADLLAEVFRHLPIEKYFLIVAGAGDPKTVMRISDLLQGKSNVWIKFERLPETEISRIYSAADVLIFPATDNFNSGTIYTALSLNVPVIAANTQSNAELQSIVGPSWVQLYDGELSADVIVRAFLQLANRSRGSVCDLTIFDPMRCADEHIAAYSSAK